MYKREKLQQRIAEASETPVMLPINSLAWDDSLYHKHMDYNKVLRMTKKFNLKKFHPILVGKRKDYDKYYVIDGRHRCLAAKALGHTEIKCHVVQTTCTLEETDIYLAANY